MSHLKEIRLKNPLKTLPVNIVFTQGDKSPWSNPIRFHIKIPSTSKLQAHITPPISDVQNLTVGYCEDKVEGEHFASSITRIEFIVDGKHRFVAGLFAVDKHGVWSNMFGSHFTPCWHSSVRSENGISTYTFDYKLSRSSCNPNKGLPWILRVAGPMIGPDFDHNKLVTEHAILVISPTKHHSALLTSVDIDLVNVIPDSFPRDVRLNLGSLPPSLGPAAGSDTNAMHMISVVFDALTRMVFDQEDQMSSFVELPSDQSIHDAPYINAANDTEGTRRPKRVASSGFDVSVSEKAPAFIPAAATYFKFVNQRSLVVTLRRGARFSNGDFVTGDHFVNSFRRLLESDTTNDLVQYLFCIQNAKEYHQKLTFSWESVGIKAVCENDTHYLLMELASPVHTKADVRALLSRFAHPPFIPIHDQFVDIHHLNHVNPICVVNGPFNVKGVTRTAQGIIRSIRVQRNPRYHHDPNLHLNSITWDFEQLTEADEVKRFKEGQLHFCGVAGDNQRLRLDRLKSVRSSQVDETFLVCFNTHHPWLKNVNLRRALRWAIDWNELDVDCVACGLIPPSHGMPMESRLTSDLLRQDLPRALKAFDAFLDETFGGDIVKGNLVLPEISFTITNCPEDKRIAYTLTGIWNKTFKQLKVSIREMEFPDLLNLIRAGPEAPNQTLEIFRRMPYADYLSPECLLSFFEDGAGKLNGTGWEDARYRECLSAAREAKDCMTQLSLFVKAERILIDQTPIIPIFHRVVRYAVCDDIAGAGITQLCHLSITHARPLRAQVIVPPPDHLLPPPLPLPQLDSPNPLIIPPSPDFTHQPSTVANAMPLYAPPYGSGEPQNPEVDFDSLPTFQNLTDSSWLDYDGAAF